MKKRNFTPGMKLHRRRIVGKPPVKKNLLLKEEKEQLEKEGKVLELRQQRLTERKELLAAKEALLEHEKELKDLEEEEEKREKKEEVFRNLLTILRNLGKADEQGIIKKKGKEVNCFKLSLENEKIIPLWEMHKILLKSVGFKEEGNKLILAKLSKDAKKIINNFCGVRPKTSETEAQESSTVSEKTIQKPKDSEQKSPPQASLCNFVLEPEKKIKPEFPLNCGEYDRWTLENPNLEETEEEYQERMEKEKKQKEREEEMKILEAKKRQLEEQKIRMEARRLQLERERRKRQKERKKCDKPAYAYAYA